MNKVEELLYYCDLQMLEERQVLSKKHKVVESSMEEREISIRDLLKQIAVLEMEKGQEEDMMLDYTLRTIEIVNINDMA